MLLIKVKERYEAGKFRRAISASRKARGWSGLAILAGVVIISSIVFGALQYFEVIEFNGSGGDFTVSGDGYPYAYYNNNDNDDDDDDDYNMINDY